jgi:hypothetical protein
MNFVMVKGKSFDSDMVACYKWKLFFNRDRSFVKEARTSTEEVSCNEKGSV